MKVRASAFADLGDLMKMVSLQPAAMSGSKFFELSLSRNQTVDLLETNVQRVSSGTRASVLSSELYVERSNTKSKWPSCHDLGFEYEPA
jgi:hypothetical protein